MTRTNHRAPGWLAAQSGRLRVASAAIDLTHGIMSDTNGTLDLEPRIKWRDATMRRNGWQCAYFTIGASLRSLPVDQPRSLSNCWVATTAREVSHDPDSGVGVALDVLDKILLRGKTPPLHPDAERLLLERSGLRDRIQESHFPGDAALRLRDAIALSKIGDMPCLLAGAPPDVTPFVDSPAEAEFVELMAEANPDAARWLIPQAAISALLESGLDGDRAQGSADGRRVDFLLAVPGRDPVVFEIDGRQHENQAEVDHARDAELQGRDIETVRVPTSQLQARSGPGFARALEIVSGATAPGGHAADVTWQVTMQATQLHRFAFAISCALRAGMLSGKRWVIRLADPTGSVAFASEPYFRMISAIFELWGAADHLPDQVCLVTDDAMVRVTGIKERKCRGLWESRKSELVDVEIVLEIDKTSLDPLPGTDRVPSVVVRSTGLPYVLATPVMPRTSRALPPLGANAREILEQLLLSVFAKRGFREGQFEAIELALKGQDCGVLLPTGSGKSIIYQLAGLCTPGSSLVISPLVALIEDQIAGLRRHGIDRALGISHYVSLKGKADHVHELVAAGDAYYVIVAPERLQIGKFRDTLRELARHTVVNQVVVDEAHCVSDWGHDFRPAYLNIGRIVRRRCADVEEKPPPLLALTGTASKPVLRDMLAQLGIADSEENIVRPTSFDRSELQFEVLRLPISSARPSLRDALA